MYGWHGYGGGFMWIFWVLIIAALVWFVVGITRDKGIASEGNATGREQSALEILRQRYARGEIDRDEFEQKKKDLSD